MRITHITHPSPTDCHSFDTPIHHIDDSRNSSGRSHRRSRRRRHRSSSQSMAERAPPAAATDEEQAHAAAAPEQHHGKVPLHRVALHVTGQPRAPHHPNGSNISTSSNGMPFVVPMDMYKENRLKLCERLRAKGVAASSVVLMEGGKEEFRHESDTEKLFRQESSFAYLFGVKEPGFYGAIKVGTGEATLFMPRLPAEYAVWMGPIRPPADFQALYEVDAVQYVDELPAFFASARPPAVYRSKGRNTDSGSEARPAAFDGMEEAFKAGWVGKVDDALLYPELVECRVHKSAKEVALLQYVNDVSSDAHFAVMAAATPGMAEFQLESTFLHHCYFHGGCRHVAYTSICACGPSGAVLHYGHAAAPNDRALGPPDMLLLDMGCEYACYASDITCAFPASGTFTADQRLVFEAVQAMQFAVLDALRPGVAWKDMHELAYRVGLEKLVAGGLLTGPVDAMLAANAMAFFMPHGLGHFMGLDVHDVGGYPEGSGLTRDSRRGFKSLRTLRTMEAGMVITVEPGIYFIDPLLDELLADPALRAFVDEGVLARFRGFGGVRLEDDVVITETGIVNLTNCPRTVEDVEAVMAGRITDRRQLFKKY